MGFKMLVPYLILCGKSNWKDSYSSMKLNILLIEPILLDYLIFAYGSFKCGNSGKV